jgi:hypothetical protein
LLLCNIAPARLYPQGFVAFGLDRLSPKPTDRANHLALVIDFLDLCLHSVRSRPCRFAYVKLASPIFWNFFPKIRCGGNTASTTRWPTVAGSKARRQTPRIQEARPAFLEKNSRNSGAACPIGEFQTSPPHDGRTHRNQKKKGPFFATELKEKGLVNV